MTESIRNGAEVIGVYDDRSAAEAALGKLASEQVDMSALSVIGAGDGGDGQAHGFHAVGDRLRAWGATGGLWGAAWALLLGSAVFVMPPFGVVAAAGPIAGALVSALEGLAVVGGVSALGIALSRVGLPQDDVARHEADLRHGKVLLIAHGAAGEIARVRAVLARSPA